MREILFRGRRKKGDKRWVEGDLTQGYAGYVGIVVRCCAGTSFEVVPETVGQYTGLTDKNGVKIFEGDIIRDEDGDAMIVKWQTEGAVFVLEPKPYVSVHFYGTLPSKIEVIGNIYDNPELMGGNK